MDAQKTSQFCNSFWDDKILPTLTEYVKIPALSPNFDPYVPAAVKILQIFHLLFCCLINVVVVFSFLVVIGPRRVTLRPLPS
jgi:hypothetical protein